MSEAWFVHAIVQYVHDGDTLNADIDCGWKVWTMGKSVRVHGINAPELAAPDGSGLKSRDYARSLLPVGGRVGLESSGLDKYGRALCRVTLADGRDLGDLMIQAGMAVPFMTGAA